MKKQKLEAKLKSLEASLAEKKNKVDNLSRENKLKCELLCVLMFLLLFNSLY